MQPPWTAEWAVSGELAVRLLEAQFPQLKPVRLEPAGFGFDNTVFRVNDRYLFRFPRRPIAVGLLTTERQVLPDLAELGLPLAIPEPVFFGTPSGDYPCPFLGYRYVPGNQPASLSHDQRMQSAEPLARFLRMLHGISVDRARALGVPGEVLGRLDVASRWSRLEEMRSRVLELGLWRDRRSLDEFAESLLPYPEVDGSAALVHGDLHIRNVLVDDAGRLTGVIDWGDVHIGHPAVDLAFVYGFFPPEGRERVFQQYGEVDANARRLARFRAVFTLLNLMLFAHDQKDDVLLRAATDSLSFALSP